MIRITCWISRDTDYYHAARWLGGLQLLQRQKAISLTFLPGTFCRQDADSDALSIVHLLEFNGRQTLFVVDLRDRSDEFSPLIAHCDVYLKRSYCDLDVAALEVNAHKVKPLGMNYGCRVPWLAATVGFTLLPSLLRSPQQGLRWAVQQAHTLRAIPRVRQFEASPDFPKQPSVLYQTRVWEHGETGAESAEIINVQRVELIRALRESFGPRFRGGLVPTQLAKSQFPDALAQDCWNKSDYITMSRRQAIGVYTRGLHYSTAWKLPEYLAASLCIVAEPPRNTEPSPLLSKVHFLPFSTPNECVLACASLLNDIDAARNMREENHRYYRRELAPDVWVSHRIEEIIKRMFGDEVHLYPARRDQDAA